MNRTEQKERLNDIIYMGEEVVSSLIDQETLFDDIVLEFRTVLQTLETNSFEGALEVSEEEFASSLLEQMLDSTEFDTFKESISDFQSDIEDYASEISESRAEKLEERYQDLETISDELESITEDESNLKELIELLEEKLVWLKAMKK